MSDTIGSQSQILSDGLLRWSWSEYFCLAQDLAKRLDAKRPLGVHSLRLRSPTLEQGLLGIAVASQLGLALIFDEKQAGGEVSSGVWDAPQEEFWTRPPASLLEIYPLTVDEAPPFCVEQLRVNFSTSGSTGQVKFVAKSGQGLAAEVAAWSEIFGLKADQKVIALVRPFHIYGFLHAFLLPLKARCRLFLVASLGGLPDLNGLPLDPELLVGVPAQWSLMAHLLAQGRCGTLISSGASFGVHRREELELFRSSVAQAFEILGSTETGGIAFRSLFGTEGPYELLSGVEILDVEAGGTYISSPFIGEAKEAFTSDILEVCGERKVWHRGRADRVFKYGGKRFALQEIEAALSSLCEGAQALCHYSEDFSRAQGGTLRAWIETSRTFDVAALRVRYLASFELPFPQRLAFVTSLPRDQQGKLQLQKLMHDA